MKAEWHLQFGTRALINFFFLGTYLMEWFLVYYWSLFLVCTAVQLDGLEPSNVQWRLPVVGPPDWMDHGWSVLGLDSWYLGIWIHHRTRWRCKRKSIIYAHDSLKWPGYQLIHKLLDIPNLLQSVFKIIMLSILGVFLVKCFNICEWKGIQGWSSRSQHCHSHQDWVKPAFYWSLVE